MNAADLSRFDDGFAVKGPGRPVAPAVAAATSAEKGFTPPTIWNGIYTLTFPDGSHKTWRIFTKAPTARFAPGKRIIALLIGPDNTDDFESVAFLEPDGPRIWKRFKDTKVGINVGILCELATGMKHEGYELLVSRRCLCCNRPLTDPISLELGIGPFCRKAYTA